MLKRDQKELSACYHFKKDCCNARVQEATSRSKGQSNVYISKWKPLHLMIYYNRVEMIDDIITFAGRSFKKAITIENRKCSFVDDFHPLKL